MLTILTASDSSSPVFRNGGNRCTGNANRGKIVDIHNLSTSKHYILCLPFINTLIVDEDR